MATIKLEIFIKAPIQVCFDTARNIDAHVRSTAWTKERAIAGRTTGMCEEGDTITFQAVHIGVRQKLTSKIVAMKKYSYFEDQMLKGAFKSMRHKHFFEEANGGTIMKDELSYEVPLGFIGKFFDKIYLEQYMTSFLNKRNEYLKEYIEKEYKISALNT